MGGTLSAAELRLTLRLLLRPPAAEAGAAEDAFEKAFARAVRVPHAVSFGSGRVALWAILRALRIAEGDEVIIPGYTCVAVPNAVRFSGAQPVYADIDPLTYNVTAASCERIVTPRTRALVVGHTYGLPAPMAELREFAEARGLFLIEDAAHALGSEYRGKPVGSLGHAAFFSTEHSKTISTALGGVATTADPLLAEQLQSLQATFPYPDRNRIRRILIPHLIFGLCYRTLQKRLGDLLLFRSRLYRRAAWSTPECEHQGLEPPAYRWRMGEALARLGLEQLRRLPRPECCPGRGRQAILLRASWSGASIHPPLPVRIEPSTSACPIFPAAATFYWRRPRRKDLELGLWFELPVHPERTELAAVGYTHGDCPVAERTSRRIVNLPCHPGVTSSDVARYLDLLARVEG